MPCNQNSTQSECYARNKQVEEHCWSQRLSIRQHRTHARFHEQQTVNDTISAQNTAYCNLTETLMNDIKQCICAKEPLKAPTSIPDRIGLFVSHQWWVLCFNLWCYESPFACGSPCESPGETPGERVSTGETACESRWEKVCDPGDRVH